LNLDDENCFHFADEEIGPVKPGNAFWKWLGRGPALKIPIADTLYVGGNNHTTKLLFNDEKGVVQQYTAQFDQQSLKDQFLDLCTEKFIQKSNYLCAPTEPLYNRMVALQKRTASNPRKAFTNQNADLLFPISLHAHLLDITEGSGQSSVIQKFIKSRGKRPSVYRLFWKASSNETGSVEGWNITKVSDEFQLPEIILPNSLKSSSTVNEETLTGSALEEYQFKKQSTKLIASFLQAGQQYYELNEPTKIDSTPEMILPNRRNSSEHRHSHNPPADSSRNRVPSTGGHDLPSPTRRSSVMDRSNVFPESQQPALTNAAISRRASIFASPKANVVVQEVHRQNENPKTITEQKDINKEMSFRPNKKKKNIFDYTRQEIDS
jgi:hypothetical protein